MNPGCEALGLGLLFGAAFVSASLLWHVLVRPQVVLAWFREGEPTTPDATTLRALRVAVGTLVFVLGGVAGGVVALWMRTVP